MFGSFGFTELILILAIVLLIFGAGKLPQLGEGLGKAIRGFKKSVNDADATQPEVQGTQQQMAAVPQQQTSTASAQGPVPVEQQPVAPVQSASRG